MIEARTFGLSHDEARRRAIATISIAPADWFVKLLPPKRTLEQNAAQWPILEAFADQVEWVIDGRRQKMPAEDWKAILTAAFEAETSTRVALGLNGGFVMLPSRTSSFSRKKFSDWLEFLHATAAAQGVTLAPPTTP